MISINGLTVAYGGYTLLDSIDFHISEKDKIGLVGKNGAGKSTIMKLICGLQSPISGSIDKPNDLRIGYLPQIMEHHKGRTVMEETLTAFDHITETTMHAPIWNRKRTKMTRPRAEQPQIRVNLLSYFRKKGIRTVQSGSLEKSKIYKLFQFKKLGAAGFRGSRVHFLALSIA